MTVLVTGATGFVGPHAVHALRAREVPVRALVRDPQRASRLASWGAELVQGDATCDRIAGSVIDIVAQRPAYLAACDAVKLALEANLDDRSPSARVAEMLSPWIA